MVTFRNNNVKRNNFRRNGRSDRNFKPNSERKFSSSFSSSENFQRKIPGRNNHNAPKLIEKYKAGESFAPELKIFKEHIHPAHINETIKLLESYNTILENNSLDNTDDNQSDSLQVKLLEKFVKIKKIEPVDNKLVKIKSDIGKRFEVFMNYIYSQNLQDSLVK